VATRALWPIGPTILSGVKLAPDKITTGDSQGNRLVGAPN